MANFNEKINSRKKFFLFADGYDYFIERFGSMRQLEREFDYRLKVLKGVCRLFIQYKDTCRVQKMAGRCFMWAYTSKTIGSYDVRRLCLDRDGAEDLDNFGNPRFECISGAVLISDKSVYMYGDTQFETVDLEKNYVTCRAHICGRFVSEFRIPAEVFDRGFGLKENFPKQYETVFGKTEDAKPVQEENDLIEEAKRSVELCKNLLYSTKQVIDRSIDLIQGAIIEIEDRSDQDVELIQGALIDIEDRKRELDNLDDILSSLDDTLYKSTQKEEQKEERR